jgi:predicted RNA-binding protein with PUA-like domain
MEKSHYWLMKSEPDVYSIDDLRRDKRTAWNGVRNYQARNHMRAMTKGDLVLFYHSSSDPTGVAGVAKVVKEAYPDPTQFDRKSDYYDAEAKREAPRWFNVDVRALKKIALIPLAALREAKPLKNMVTLRPGNRLSITPVTEAEWKYITTKLA